MSRVVHAPILLALGCLLPLIGVGACTTPPAQGCPDGTTQIAVWSSQTDKHSKLQFLSDTQALGHRDIPVQGILFSTPATIIGRKAYLFATGNIRKDRAHLVEVDLDTCNATTSPLQGKAMLAGLVAPTYGANSVSFLDRTELYRFSLDGTTQAHTTLPDITINAMVPHESTILAFTIDNTAEHSTLLVLDATTLTTQRTIPLPGIGLGFKTAAIVGNTLYFPVNSKPGKEGDEDRRLAMIDLTTWELTTTTLNEVSPYFTSPTPHGILIAHSYLNPSIRPMHQYRHITLTNPDGTILRETDLDLGILTIQTTSDRITILGIDPAEERHAATYRLSDFTKISDITLGPTDQWGSHHYPATILPR
ncbi:MAG: hypothetical protein Q3997_02135 [Propionibacteriaceae bacterium]|nr:hypothetical protein [Propionibacteriaceae bacterium]